jgi:Nitrous oxide-stimulated promoter
VNRPSLLPTRGRLGRERRTVAAMIELRCRDLHAVEAGACDECQSLGEYADARLEKCPYGDEKPTCVNCPIHCYARAERERMKEVMRYSGPRMLLRHPILAIRHMLDGRKQAPPLKRCGRGPDRT